MPRFFLSGGSTVAGGTAFIAGEDAKHVKVLRLRVGDKLILCDGKGLDYHCSVKTVVGESVECEVFESKPCLAEPSVKVQILVGLPKGDKAETIIQKCVESGADEIWFFPSERCVMRLRPGSEDKKLERFRKIAEEAAKQSGRGIIPHVGLLNDIAEAFNRAKATDLPLFMYETGERESMRQAVESTGEIRSAAIITGPEGGFEPFEAELARRVGIHICSMGPRIFRCETAPVAALSALMYATGNLD